MKSRDKQAITEEGQEERKSYSAPAIVYEGMITARAGSPPLGNEEPYGTGVDPSDLFGGSSGE